MDIIYTIFDSLREVGLWPVFLLTLLKVLTSVAIAVQEETFVWDKFGDMFSKDFLKLVVVTAITYLYPDIDAIAGTVVAAYVGYLAVRVMANVGVLFPELGARLPASLQEVKTPADDPRPLAG